MDWLFASTTPAKSNLHPSTGIYNDRQLSVASRGATAAVLIVSVAILAGCKTDADRRKELRAERELYEDALSINQDAIDDLYERNMHDATLHPLHNRFFEDQKTINRRLGEIDHELRDLEYR